MSAPRNALIALLVALLASAGWAASNPDEAKRVLAGRALFRGEVPFAKTPQLQGVPLAGAACVQCHGQRGEARNEAGVSVPSIQWQPLMQGRDALPAFGDAHQVMRAIAQGVGRQGKALRPPMPRFEMTPGEQQSLLAYLKVLATDAEPIPGVSASRVVVASVLPLSGPQRAVGEQIRAALGARFDAINAEGGVFGRRIELRAIDGGDGATRASQAALAVLQDAGQGIFALVGSLLPDPDADLRQWLKTHDVPMVATLGIAQAEPRQRQVTYLLPSLEAQLRELAAEMAKQCGAARGATRLLHPPGARSQAVMRATLPEWQMTPVASVSQWDGLARDAGDGQLIALLARDQVEALRVRMNAANSARCLGTLAVVSGQPESDGAARFAEAVALPMPPVVQDSARPEGAALWTLLGDTAARVFAEALARSGRQLDAERFAQALDTLHRFQPVPGLSVSYGPLQRHGFDVTYLWRENSYGPPHTTP